MNHAKKLLALFVLALLLTGCNNELTFSEVSIEDTNQDVQEFLDSVEKENGNYLYVDSTKEIYYVFLNGKNVKQGSEAAVFSDFDVNVQDGTLNILFNREYTSDYSNHHVKHQMLHKITTNDEIHTIKLFGNGESESIDLVSGTQ